MREAAALAGEDPVIWIPRFREGRLLTMMSACGSNKLTSFSLAFTAWPSRTRRWLWVRMRSISVDGGEAHCKIEFDWLDGVFK